MKSMKKLVLAALILLASVVVLAGCKNDSVPEVPKYTVKFAKGNNTDEVSDLPADLTVESGTVLTAEQLKPLTNTKNYVFVGWYDGETKAVAGNYTVTKDVTLTAQWESVIIEKPNTEQSGGSGQPSGTSGENDSVPEVPKHTVTFAKGNNTDDVSDLPADLTVESGTILTDEQLKPLTNTKNYVFVGWYDGETKAVAGTYTVTENVTLTAQWESIINVNVTEANFTESLNKAMANPDIILILESAITVSETIKIESGNVTIDLNGKTLKKESGTVVNVAKAATLTIMDTGTKGSISGNLGVENYGSLTVEGGSISASGANCYGVFNYGSLKVAGGEISGDSYGVFNYGSLTVEGGSISGGSSGVSNNGSLTVEGGSISGGYSGVSNYGSLTVTGGIISASGENSDGVYNNDSGKLTVEGGSISGGSSGVSNYGSLKVKGGCISASGENSVGVYNNGSGTLEVTGGSISGVTYGVYNDGRLTVEGGSISADGENSLGVFNNGSLTVKDGIISGSGAGSIGVFNEGALNLSGAPKITTSENGSDFYLTSPITLVGALTGDGIYYSVKWGGDTPDGTKIVVGGEQVTLTADIEQKFTFKDIKVEFDESTKALVVKN